MDLKELRYVVALADEGSISGAAANLYMAQSSLSQFLQQYEASIGSQLFYRTSTGIRLTSAGAVFVPKARQILHEYDMLRNELIDIEELQGGTIKLGISSFRGTYLFPPILKEFHSSYPKVHVNLIEKDIQSIEPELSNGNLDIGLIALPVTKNNIKTEFLKSDEILLVAARDHPVLQYAKMSNDNPKRLWIDLKDTAEYDYILSKRTTMLGMIGRSEFRLNQINPPSTNNNVTAALAAAFAKTGIALAFTYRSCISDPDDAVYLSIGEKGVYLDLAIGFPANAYHSKAIRALGNTFHQVMNASYRW